MKCDSRSLLTSALSVIFMYHSMVKGSVDALWTKLAAPFFDKVGTNNSSDLLKEIKIKQLRMESANLAAAFRPPANIYMISPHHPKDTDTCDRTDHDTWVYVPYSLRANVDRQTFLFCVPIGQSVE